jgi:hypothetical protein
MVDELYWSSIFGIFGSLLVILIMLDNTPLYISRDPCIEGIIGTTEDVGKIANRKEDIGDR